MVTKLPFSVGTSSVAGRGVSGKLVPCCKMPSVLLLEAMADIVSVEFP
jgi:hypothetical protein